MQHRVTDLKWKQNKHSNNITTYAPCTDEKIYTKFLWENQKERDQSEDLDVDGRIILDWILRKQVEKVSTGCI